MANGPTVHINIQTKSDLAKTLSATTKAANATYASLKRLDGIKLPNFGANFASGMKASNAQARQLALNYGKTAGHERALYDSTKALNRLKMPAWQKSPAIIGKNLGIARPSSTATAPKGTEREENVEVWRAIYRQQKQKQADEFKHKKAIEKEEARLAKERAKREKASSEQWRNFSSSFYRVQSLMDRFAFFGSIGVNMFAFPLFGGIKNFAKESFDAIGDIRRMRMELQMSAGDIQNFGRIVQEQGGKQQDANEALMTFHENILKAAKGDPNALRIFNMTGTPFMSGTGQIRPTGDVLRDFMRNYGRLLSQGGANFRRQGALEYMQSMFGRGGDYLYTGIRGSGDFAERMRRRSYATTEGQERAWTDVKGAATDARMQLQQRAFAFVEKNKAFIMDAIRQSQKLANAVIWILDTPWIMSAIKWATIGAGAIFLGGGFLALMTNTVFMFRNLATALTSGGLVTIIKKLIGASALGSIMSQSTKSWISAAGGRIAAGVGAAILSFLRNPATIATLAVVVSLVLLAVKKKQEATRIDEWFKKNPGKNLPKGSPLWLHGRNMMEDPLMSGINFGNEMKRRAEESAHGRRGTGRFKIDININNTTGSGVRVKASSEDAESTDIHTTLFNHFPSSLGSAPMYA